MKVKRTGSYSFQSDSEMDLYGVIYVNKFNPLTPAENLLGTDDDSALDLQMKLSTWLTTEMRYVLVVTTSRHEQIGAFSIVVSGDEKLMLQRLGKCRDAWIGCSSRLLAKNTEVHLFDFEQSFANGFVRMLYFLLGQTLKEKSLRVFQSIDENQQLEE